MTRKRATRQSCNSHRVMSYGDTQSIYENTCKWAGVILALTFGIIFFVGCF